MCYRTLCCETDEFDSVNDEIYCASCLRLFGGQPRAGFKGYVELLDTFPVLENFTFEHLPQHLQDISSPFCVLAIQTARRATNRPSSKKETELALDRLMAAKDAAIRAALPPKHVLPFDIVEVSRIPGRGTCALLQFLNEEFLIRDVPHMGEVIAQDDEYYVVAGPIARALYHGDTVTVPVRRLSESDKRRVRPTFVCTKLSDS